VLVDSGAGTRFIAERLANELALTLTRKKVGDRVGLANGDLSSVTRTPTHSTPYDPSPKRKLSETFHLLPLARFDLVLG
jgi:hypothetical protein